MVKDWKPLVDICDPWALRQPCMRNCHVTMINKYTWEDHGKSLHTVWCCTANVTWNWIRHGRKHVHLNSNAFHFSTQAYLRWKKRRWHMLCDQMTSPFYFAFVKKQTSGFKCQSWKQPSRLLSVKSGEEKMQLWWFGGASVPVARKHTSWHQMLDFSFPLNRYDHWRQLLIVKMSK